MVQIRFLFESESLDNSAVYARTANWGSAPVGASPVKQKTDDHDQSIKIFRPSLMLSAIDFQRLKILV